MLMLLKLVCFTIWLVMMMRLILTGSSQNGERNPVTLRLIDPEQAEYEVKAASHYLTNRSQLYLEISCRNPCWPELLFIAYCLQRTNPSIVISTEPAENSLVQP
jgi:hypothetical protein